MSIHSRRGVSDVPGALRAIKTLGTGPASSLDSEDPVFVLAAGWRTGSTMLQRMLLTDSRILVWGEPYGPMELWASLSRCLEWVSEEQLGSRLFLDDDLGELSDKFVANLYPDPENLRLSFQRLAYDLLGAPAKRAGYTRWGMKEVRLDAADALMLHWLFPRARFLFLVRNPFEAYASMRPMKMWREWRDSPRRGVKRHARYWNSIACSWSLLPPDFPKRVMRYEQLVLGEGVAEMAEWANLDIDASRVLDNRVGSTKKKVSLTDLETELIAQHCSAGIEAFDYHPP